MPLLTFAHVVKEPICTGEEYVVVFPLPFAPFPPPPHAQKVQLVLIPNEVPFPDAILLQSVNAPT